MGLLVSLRGHPGREAGGKDRSADSRPLFVIVLLCTCLPMRHPFRGAMSATPAAADNLPSWEISTIRVPCRFEEVDADHLLPISRMACVFCVCVCAYSTTAS